MRATIAPMIARAALPISSQVPSSMVVVKFSRDRASVATASTTSIDAAPITRPVPSIPMTLGLHRVNATMVASRRVIPASTNGIPNRVGGPNSTLTSPVTRRFQDHPDTAYSNFRSSPSVCVER
jgi:hypothetical protein